MAVRGETEKAKAAVLPWDDSLAGDHQHRKAQCRTMNAHHIDIGRDFAKALGLRYRAQGPYSGEEFRDDFLEPAFLKYDVVVIGLDSITGYTSSFFEEAFGGLVRKHGLASVQSKISFDATKRAYLVPTIEAWMKEAEDDRIKKLRKG